MLIVYLLLTLAFSLNISTISILLSIKRSILTHVLHSMRRILILIYILTSHFPFMYNVLYLVDQYLHIFNGWTQGTLFFIWRIRIWDGILWSIRGLYIEILSTLVRWILWGGNSLSGLNLWIGGIFHKRLIKIDPIIKIIKVCGVYIGIKLRGRTLKVTIPWWLFRWMVVYCLYFDHRIEKVEMDQLTFER